MSGDRLEKASNLMPLTGQADLVEIADVLDVMAKPHYGSACQVNAALDGVPCATRRQESIWLEYGGLA